MEEMLFGFKPSEIDGSEKIFGTTEQIELPEKYSFKAYMSPILDQGSDPICVPCTVSAYLNWKENLKDGVSRDNRIALYDIYKSKTTVGEGMTFKEAFKYVKNQGVKSKKGKLKISSYGMVTNILDLRYAIVMNGPCFGALPVYNMGDEFWNKTYGDNLVGYHAISIIGYDENGFFIRNSWGESFGDDGYTYIKIEDMDKMIELWTIID
jgi:hypothetical protein